MKFFQISVLLILLSGCTTTEHPDYIGKLPSYVKKSVDIAPTTCHNSILTIQKGE